MKNTREGIDVGFRHFEVNDNFVKIPNEFFTDKRFTDRERFVFMFLSRNIPNFRITQRWIAKELGYSPSTVKRIIDGLESKGALKMVYVKKTKEYVYVLTDLRKL